MSRGTRGRATTPYSVEYVDKATEPAAVRVRSGLTLAVLVVGLAVITAVAAIVLIVVALALATTATS
jgi:hypothetical protein